MISNKFILTTLEEKGYTSPTRYDGHCVFCEDEDLLEFGFSNKFFNKGNVRRKYRRYKSRFLNTLPLPWNTPEARIKRMVDYLKKSHDSTSKKIILHKEMIKTLEAKIKRIGEGKGVSQDRVKKLSEELEVLKKRLANHSERLQRLNSVMDEFSSKGEKYRKAISIYRKKMERQQKMVEAMRRYTTSLYNAAKVVLRKSIIGASISAGAGLGIGVGYALGKKYLDKKKSENKDLT